MWSNDQLTGALDLGFNDLQSRVGRQPSSKLFDSNVRLSVLGTVATNPIRTPHLSPQPNTPIYVEILALRARLCRMIRLSPLNHNSVKLVKPKRSLPYWKESKRTMNRSQQASWSVKNRLLLNEQEQSQNENSASRKLPAGVRHE